MIDNAKEYNNSLGNAALHYEMEILGITEEEARQEMENRLNIMIDSVNDGLDDNKVSMALTSPSAKKILASEKKVDLLLVVYIPELQLGQWQQCISIIAWE